LTFRPRFTLSAKVFWKYKKNPQKYLHSIKRLRCINSIAPVRDEVTFYMVAGIERAHSALTKEHPQAHGTQEVGRRQNKPKYKTATLIVDRLKAHDDRVPSCAVSWESKAGEEE
jgi:hypothetical protein